MTRRHLLSLLGSLPFLGWVKPTACAPIKTPLQRSPLEPLAFETTSEWWALVDGNVARKFFSDCLLAEIKPMFRLELDNVSKSDILALQQICRDLQPRRGCRSYFNCLDDDLLGRSGTTGVCGKSLDLAFPEAFATDTCSHC